MKLKGYIKDINSNKKSNFELLRLICILMIIGHHAVVYTHGLDFTSNPTSITALWLCFIRIGGKLGVNIFMILSGYFMIKSENVSIAKLLKLIIQCVTISVGIYLLFVSKNLTDFTIQKLLEACFPITNNTWWFISNYIVIFIFHPYINKLLNSLSQAQYKKLLITATICFSLMSTVTIFTTNDYWNINIIWFIYLYALAGYIRIFAIEIERKKMTLIALIIITIAAIITSHILLQNLEQTFNTTTNKSWLFYHQNTILMLILSLLVFYLFKNIEIGSIPIINFLAEGVLGIYLIHDNPYVRERIWNQIIKLNTYEDNVIFPSIFAIFNIFVICEIIELLRIHLIEKLYMIYINKKIQKTI